MQFCCSCNSTFSSQLTFQVVVSLRTRCFLVCLSIYTLTHIEFNLIWPLSVYVTLNCLNTCNPRSIFHLLTSSFELFWLCSFGKVRRVRVFIKTVFHGKFATAVLLPYRIRDNFTVGTAEFCLRYRRNGFTFVTWFNCLEKILHNRVNSKLNLASWLVNKLYMQYYRKHVCQGCHPI